MGAQMDVADMV